MQRESVKRKAAEISRAECEVFAYLTQNTTCNYIIIYTEYCPLDWLDSVGSRILYELDPKNPILYVLPIENILGKLPVVPFGDTGTIPFNFPRNAFPGAYRDRKQGAGDGCRMWYVNSWAMGWSRDM